MHTMTHRYHGIVIGVQTVKCHMTMQTFAGDLFN